MKKIASIAVLMMTALMAQAQKVTFYSPEFEDGIRYHIGLDESADIQQNQVDTITTLSLSGLGITDIRDVVYLTSVRKLDLSYNKIKDISPLLTLESLEELNLSNNRLESVDILAFIQSESLEVDVSFNFISDFSYFYSPTECEFTFIGMGMQSEKDAPYFDVYQFYSDINDDDKPVVSFRGYTNMSSSAYLKCGNAQVTAAIDGEIHEVTAPGNPTTAAEVFLTNGEKSETTYIIPVSEYTVGAGKTLKIDKIVLPDGYTLSSAFARTGKVEIVDNAMVYTAAEKGEADVVRFSFYQGSELKGYSRFYVNKQIKGDVNGDGDVNASDIVELVCFLNGEPTSAYHPAAADVNGDGEVNGEDVDSIVNIIMQK